MLMINCINTAVVMISLLLFLSVKQNNVFLNFFDRQYLQQYAINSYPHFRILY